MQADIAPTLLEDVVYVVMRYEVIVLQLKRDDHHVPSLVRLLDGRITIDLQYEAVALALYSALISMKSTIVLEWQHGRLRHC